MWELVEGPALRTQLAGPRFRAVDRLGALLAIEARHVAAREHRPHHADGRTIRDTAAHSGLLRCNNQWSAKNTFAVRWRFCSAENEHVRVAGSSNRWRKMS